MTPIQAVAKKYACRPRPLRLCVESLEERQLLSALGPFSNPPPLVPATPKTSGPAMLRADVQAPAAHDARASPGDTTPDDVSEYLSTPPGTNANAAPSMSAGNSKPASGGQVPANAPAPRGADHSAGMDPKRVSESYRAPATAEEDAAPALLLAVQQSYADRPRGPASQEPLSSAGPSAVAQAADVHGGRETAPPAWRAYTAGAVPAVNYAPVRPGLDVFPLSPAVLGEPKDLASAGESVLEAYALVGVREVLNVSPQVAGLLAGAPAFDVGALERGLDRFFSRLEELGNELIHPQTLLRIAPWVIIVTATVGAYELARWRRDRRLAPGPVPSLARSDPDWAWMPSVSLRPPEDEP